MILSRRRLLKGAALLGAAGSMPAAARLARAPTLAVTDSRLPEGLAFARMARRAGAELFDLARGPDAFHALARRDLAPDARVIGLTGWSDWVGLRGVLQDKGKRVRAEQRLTHSGPRRATPFRWEMG